METIQRQLIDSALISEENAQKLIETDRKYFTEEGGKVVDIMIELLNNDENINFASIYTNAKKDVRTYLTGVNGNYQIYNFDSVLKNFVNGRQKDILKEYLESAYLNVKDGACAQTEIDKIAEIFQGESKESSLVEVCDILENGFENLFQDVETIKTGYEEIDRKINGFQKKQLHILAARPGMGKTTLALNFARNISEFKKVVIFTMEVSKEEIVLKFLNMLSGVDSFKIQKNILNNDEREKVIQAQEFIKNRLDLVVYDDISNYHKIISKIKLHTKKNDCFIIIDYLQLMNGYSAGSRDLEIGYYTRGLKKAANNCPILCLSQLNRKGSEGKPNLSHLRESGSIENDANFVYFLYCDEEVNIKTEEHDITFIVEKARNARVGDCELVFKKNRSLFIDKNYEVF